MGFGFSFLALCQILLLGSQKSSPCVAYRSMGAPWPLWLSVSVGGRSVAAYPAGPELRDSPSAGSRSAQTVPSASCSACRDTVQKDSLTPSADCAGRRRLYHFL